MLKSSIWIVRVNVVPSMTVISLLFLTSEYEKFSAVSRLNWVRKFYSRLWCGNLILVCQERGGSVLIRSLSFVIARTNNLGVKKT